MTLHKATPDQWQTIERYANLGIVLNSCIIELRDRVAALESAANSKLTPNSSQIRSFAPAGGLVELVQKAISYVEFPHGNDEACAAILVIAEWLDQPHNAYGALHARRLREEVERHG